MNNSEKAILATNFIKTLFIVFVLSVTIFIKTLFIVFALSVAIFAMQAKDTADNDFYECEKKSGVGRCEK